MGVFHSRSGSIRSTPAFKLQSIDELMYWKNTIILETVVPCGMDFLNCDYWVLACVSTLLE